MNKNNPVAVVAASLIAAVAPAALYAAGDVTDASLIADSRSGENWPRKNGNARGQHYSALSQVNAGNVGDLGVAWSTALPVSDGIAGTPIVVDGVIYIGAAYSNVMALDAASGELLWSYDPELRSALGGNPALSWIARANRGVAVGDGNVFVATADCRLIAIDAADGEPEWEATTCNPDFGYAISDSPYYGGGKVFVGNAGSESGLKNRGYVTAYDAKTGRQVWRFYTVPSDDDAQNTSAAMKMAADTWSGDALETFGGGGSAWNEMTYDPVSRLLYFGTAGALPYEHAYRSPEGGDALFTSSVLAVNADTGEYVWHYQTVPEDSWEYNATMNIALADLEIEGQSREVLLIAPKNGFQYVLDRRTGEFLAADKYAYVNWATHINPESGRPVLTDEANYWTHEPGSKVLAWPNMWGAHSWNPMAYSPLTRLVYIPVIDVPTEVSMLEDGDWDDTLKMVTEIDGRPFDPGKLVAWDPVRQRAVWTVPHELPFNGGVLATAGNLVFQGDAFGEFSAYRADTGDRVWSVPTGSSIGAAPASYAIDGEQFILLAAGTGGGLQYRYPEMHAVDRAQGPTRLIAFTLDGSSEVSMPDMSRRTLPAQPEPEADAAGIELGATLYGEHCAGCHGRSGTARYGGSVPDLRYADGTVHEAWHAIVVGGSRQANGMPAVDVSIDESETIRQYVLTLSQALRESNLD